MNAIVKAQSQLPAQVSESTALLQVIERAATDPNVDISKMERLLAMHGEIRRQQAEEAFSRAMSDAQSEMGRISTDATNPNTKSRYASYGQLDRTLRPIYTKHGFSLSFGTGKAETPEYVKVLCTVAHAAGHSREYHIDMQADGKGAKGGDVMTKTHAVGSGVSYGMRYLLKMIFNVAIGEDDNDGNGEVELISEKEAADLKAKAEEVGADKNAFLTFFKIDYFSDMPKSKFKQAIGMLNEKGRRGR